MLKEPKRIIAEEPQSPDRWLKEPRNNQDHFTSVLLVPVLISLQIKNRSWIFMPKKNPRRTDKEWLDLIQECRSSGLSDKCWCQEHHIHTSNFYYQIRRLRQKACEIPEPVHSSFSGKQEVVPLSFEEPAVCPSSVQLKTDTIPDSVIKITYHSFQIEITNAADRETIFHTLSALQDLC